MTQRNGNGMRWADGVQPRSTGSHQQMVHDLSRLHDTRVLLVDRLSHVVVALTLTLDAETAAAERLADLQEAAGARRMDSRPTIEWCRLAHRYRDIIHALESVNDELDLDHGGPVR